MRWATRTPLIWAPMAARRRLPARGRQRNVALFLVLAHSRGKVARSRSFDSPSLRSGSRRMTVVRVGHSDLSAACKTGTLYSLLQADGAKRLFHHIADSHPAVVGKQVRLLFQEDCPVCLPPCKRLSKLKPHPALNYAKCRCRRPAPAKCWFAFWRPACAARTCTSSTGIRGRRDALNRR